jgi:hypothetical protein
LTEVFEVVYSTDEGMYAAMLSGQSLTAPSMQWTSRLNDADAPLEAMPAVPFTAENGGQ